MTTTHVVLDCGRVISNLDWHYKFKNQGFKILHTGSLEECKIYSEQMAACILA